MLKMINYWEMAEPKVFGLYHIICIVIVILGTILLTKKVKNPNNKTLKVILLISGIIMLLLEIYKQLTFLTEYDEQTKTWDYSWYGFPFQFCSTPMYLMLIFVLLKPGKFQEAILCFLATFSIFGGLTVYAYPEQVFTERVGVNIQTMVHHGLQLVIGYYLIASGTVKINFKTLLKGSFVFLVLFLIALLMNIVVYNTGITNGDEFNMFYIGPYYECILPLVNLFYPNEFNIFSYLGFLILYVGGFIFVSGIVLLIAQGLKMLYFKFKKNNLSKTNNDFNE